MNQLPPFYAPNSAFIGEKPQTQSTLTLSPSFQLNMVSNGLYKVTDGIYQVRGTDLVELNAYPR